MEVSMGDFNDGPFDAPKPLESIGQKYPNKVYANTEWLEKSKHFFKHDISASEVHNVVIM